MTKPTTLLTTVGIAVAATTLAALAGCNRPPPPPAVDGRTAQIERGRLLVSIGGCNDCHTPMKFDPEIGMPVPDMSRMLSGHPQGAPDPVAAPAGHDMGVFGATMTSIKLPFGTVYTANLTPDKDTGLGDWTEEQFIATMRTGKDRGKGRALLPPMPWFNLNKLSDEDLKSVFAYLQSLKPVRNRIPAPLDPPEGARQ